jgi:hypothetical protein
MPVTVPNQRTIHIHRIKPSSDFLGIKNENWQAAARDLRAHGLMLYMYLASNKNDFSLALSPAAIREAIGMPESTCRDQIRNLIDKGYLVQRGTSNQYDFYEVPQRVTHASSGSANCGSTETLEINPRAGHVDQTTAKKIEINNIDNNRYCIDNMGGVEKQVSPTPREQEFRF